MTATTDSTTKSKIVLTVATSSPGPQEGLSLTREDEMGWRK